MGNHLNLNSHTRQISCSKLGNAHSCPQRLETCVITLTDPTFVSKPSHVFSFQPEPLRPRKLPIVVPLRLGHILIKLLRD